MLSAKAKYVWRLDDITAGMNWDWFEKFMRLFAEHGVVPLIGIVPDNRDPALNIQEARRDFWAVMRGLQDSGAADLAQHGHQHIAQGITRGRVWGARQTEFAGLPYAEQYRKIKAGRALLQQNGIRTDIWMSPYHTYDETTLQVLRDLGFTAATDGIGLFPYRRGAMALIPQQVWRPHRFPCGIITICLHTNSASDTLYQRTERFLASDVASIAFRNALQFQPSAVSEAANTIFAAVYTAAVLYKWKGSHYYMSQGASQC